MSSNYIKVSEGHKLLGCHELQSVEGIIVVELVSTSPNDFILATTKVSAKNISSKRHAMDIAMACTL